MTPQDAVKFALTQLGRRLGPRALRRLDFAVSYMYVGRWMHDRGFRPETHSRDRDALFASLFHRLGDEPVLYLEFGVYKGHSMRLWSNGLTSAESRLIGFDSFEGLPEDWHSDAPTGRFDAGGQPPAIADERVTFVKGWFDRSLPDFELPPHARLVVNLDADLYSSTKYVLEWLRAHLQAGDILYFDELFDRNQELRALDEFLSENPVELKLLGATATFNEVAFEVIA